MLIADPPRPVGPRTANFSGDLVFGIWEVIGVGKYKIECVYGCNCG